jgi:DMSO/TMAO reductase YedYZ molybdopterin-dependent catalytic subunit
VTLPPPLVDIDRWRLRVDGLVERPATLTWERLGALGVVELEAVMVCVHNPVGGGRVGNARWLGVPLTAVLDNAGVTPGADAVVAHSVDGYASAIPLDWVRGRPALVCVGMNGAALPIGHGYPARLVVPGLYGYDASVKWLRRLELTTRSAALDYWHRHGWPAGPARVRPSSRIDRPRPGERVAAGRPLPVEGLAWAPPDGVARVEVQAGEGPWVAAELAAETSPAAWRAWSVCWTPAPGAQTLRVRCFGRDGEQSATPIAPFPTGAGVYHAVRVVAGGEAGPEPWRERVPRVALARVGVAAAGVRAWSATVRTWER